MPEIKLEIKNCKDCPHWEETPFPTSDSFERAHYWWCTVIEPKKEIASYVEWHEEKGIKVPKWCPLLIK